MSKYLIKYFFIVFLDLAKYYLALILLKIIYKKKSKKNNFQ